MRFQEILLVKWRRWQKWPIWWKICHEFGEYSNLIAKRGPLESGDFNENGNSGKKANSLKVKWGKIGGHIYRTSLTWLVPSLTRSLSSVTLLNDTSIMRSVTEESARDALCSPWPRFSRLHFWDWETTGSKSEVLPNLRFNTTTIEKYLARSQALYPSRLQTGIGNMGTRLNYFPSNHTESRNRGWS